MPGRRSAKARSGRSKNKLCTGSTFSITACIALRRMNSRHTAPGNSIRKSAPWPNAPRQAARSWACAMAFDGKQPSGSLYRFSPDLKTAKMDSGYPVTNGPAWSSHYRTMYFNDSVNGRVCAFDFDLDTGELSSKRLFLQFPEEDGSPDGMNTDAEGGLWIAHWGASKITRHAPDG